MSSPERLWSLKKIAFSWPHLICRISFTTRCHGFPSLRFPWGHYGLFCKSPCDSFVLQNVGSAETPKSAFENALFVIFFFLFLLFFSEASANPFSVSAHIWNEVSLAVFHSHILNPGASWNNFLPLRFWLSLFYSGSFKCIHLNEKLPLYCTARCLSLGTIIVI